MIKEELAEILAQDPGGQHDPIEDHLHTVASGVDVPDRAIALCLLRIDESAPALRAIVDRAANGESLSADEARLLYRGLYILAGGRDSASFGSLLRLLRLPDAELEDLLGDTLIETGPQIVASLFDDDVDALLDAIADPSIDDHHRGTMLVAAGFLAWDGRIDRETMTAFLQRFYDQALGGDGESSWIAWVDAISLLGLRSLAPLVDRAWDEGRIASYILDREDFAKDLAAAEAAPDDTSSFQRRGIGYVDDVIVALDWARAAEPPQESVIEARNAPASAPILPRPRAVPFMPRFQTQPRVPLLQRSKSPGSPIVNPWRDVGRNDPCPCGSGKKAKKCCLRG